MAELIVKAQCKSVPRRITETALSATFPLWGIASPAAALVFLIFFATILQSGEQEMALKCLTFATALITLSLTCLISKKKLANDFMIVDRQGIRLPRFLGTSLNFHNYIPWQNVQNLSALIGAKSLNDSRLLISQRK